nr:RNA-directed DNA polymerase (reverse transcriptase) domain containing protein [Haemonchus contortus]
MMTFIKYENAFDSVEPAKVWEALEEQGVERIYVDVLRESYCGRTTVFRPFYNYLEITVEKGLRQDDPISPHLFCACLEHLIRRCHWDDFGVNINGRSLNHLRFGSNIVLITNSPEDASEMLRRLEEQGSQCGLTIVTSKTKVMRNSFSSGTPVLLEGSPIEDLDGYVYLGSQLNMRNDLTEEMKRRREAATDAFESIEIIVKNTENDKLRARLFNSTVLPALTYAGETWALTKSLEKQLLSIHVSLERRLLNLSQSQQIELNYADVRAMSKVKDVLLHVDEAKHRFDGYLMRAKDGRWSSATVQYEKKRLPGRPALKWADSLAHRNNVYDPNTLKIITCWTALAQNREQWRRSWDPRKTNRAD